MALYTVPTNTPSDLRVIQGPNPKAYIATYVTAGGAVPTSSTGAYAYLGNLADSVGLKPLIEWMEVKGAEGFAASDERLVKEGLECSFTLKECDPAIMAALYAGSIITTTCTTPGGTSSIAAANAASASDIRTTGIGGIQAAANNPTRTFYRFMVDLPSYAYGSTYNLRMQIEWYKASFKSAGESKFGRDEATSFPVIVTGLWDTSITPVAGTNGNIATIQWAEA